MRCSKCGVEIERLRDFVTAALRCHACVQTRTNTHIFRGRADPDYRRESPTGLGRAAQEPAWLVERAGFELSRLVTAVLRCVRRIFDNRAGSGIEAKFFPRGDAPAAVIAS
jgi:hypothetical protein